MTSTTQWIQTLIIGVWLPVGTILITYFVYQIYGRRLRDRSDRMSMDILYMREAQHREAENKTRALLEDLLDRTRSQESFQQKYLESNLERISDLIRRELRQVLAHERNLSAKDVSIIVNNELAPLLETLNEFQNTIAIPSHSTDSNLPHSSNSNIMREISHAMHTPLSRIRAAAMNVEALNPSPEISAKMRNTKAAIDICFAYLAAYRNLISVTIQTSSWTPDSLSEAINSCADVYKEFNKKDITFQVFAPDSVRGLSNTLLLAVLLPLLENSVEECQNGDTVRIEITEKEEKVLLTVSNPLHSDFNESEAMNPGFTTKNIGAENKEHEGLGLTIVQNLLQNLPKATIEIKHTANVVHFIIKIIRAAE